MAESTNTNDFKRGMVLDLPEGLFQILEFQHHKPGKGNAVVRTKLRNLRNGGVLDRTFNSDSKVGMARLEKREMQYLYEDGEAFCFMDNETYEQTTLSRDDVGDGAKFLVEGIVAIVSFHEGNPLSVDLPTTVDLRVTHTDPGLK